MHELGLVKLNTAVTSQLQKHPTPVLHCLNELEIMLTSLFESVLAISKQMFKNMFLIK